MASAQTHIFAKLLFDHLLAASFLTKDILDFPDVGFTPPRLPVTGGSTVPGPYVSVSFMPNTSDLDGIAFDSGLNDAGLLGLNVVWPAGQGVRAPIQFAAQLVNLFKPSTILVDNDSGVQVRVYEQPRVAPVVEGNEAVTIPVVVRWVGWTPTGG